MRRSPTQVPLIITRLCQRIMDCSSEARTLRQVDGRTRLDGDLSEPWSQLKSLTTRRELYTLITDETLEFMVNYYTPRLDDLGRDVHQLSNDIDGLSNDLGAMSEDFAALGSTITTLQEVDLVF